ncbi:methylated-DNA--[protein]-cysteine S-methyltransferase [Hydrogenophaga sp.]|uniref:methylated-DNA--[protein]-cysteine S-methyltransferase n=1 Tax=Hydrogenophaga sp. TaxID=1904254 RepID=UPI0025BE6BB4|nr:methylated-DNA--[protein]-cysteine S-methyltransferase [Hydrogenophaga sp.]
MKLPHTLACTTVASPLGPLLLAGSEQGLAGLWFDDQQHQPDAQIVANWTIDADHPLLRRAALQLSAYFNGEANTFDLPLDLSAGTAFQQAVWRALLTIPYGQTASYGQIAQACGRASAVRAVGAAIGRNPVGIVVPCHRVLGADGQLNGYAGGLPRKSALLTLEGGRINALAQ